jgi:predicted nucleotidyltransferase component of viral defense system
MALEARLNQRADGAAEDVLRLRRAVAFERLLVRLACADEPHWVLKGGTALEVRYDRLARATRDVDLAFSGTEPAVDAADDLIDALASDPHGDLFTFEVTDRRVSSVVGLRGAVVRLAVTARLDGRVFERFVVDLVSSEGRSVPAETIPIGHELAFADLPTVDLRVLDLRVHFAEKLDAFTQVFADRENTRVKDLVDLVLLIERGLGADAELVDAVAQLFAEKERTLHRSPLAPPPPTWADEYAAMAEAVRLSATDIDSGFAAVQAFWHAALEVTEPSTSDSDH